MARFSGYQTAGFLTTGVVVGAAVALLYAPKAGTRTRRDIQKFSKRTFNRIDNIQDGVRDQVTDWAMELGGVVKAGKSRLEKVLRSA